MSKRPLPAARRMVLSKHGEIRALARLRYEAAERDEHVEQVAYNVLALFTEHTHLPEDWRERVAVPQPEQSRLWRIFERSFTLAEIADIEIVEPSVQIENGARITVDETLARSLYALCWERFETTLVNINALYNEEHGDTQLYRFNRVKRLLWAVDDLSQNIQALFSMTALPDEIAEDDAYDRDA